MLVARALAKRIPADLRPLKLHLKYPDDGRGPDSPVRKACELIRDQLRDCDPGIEMELLPRRVAALHREVEVDHDYELAYYWYDFPDESYWLWPLFDPEGRARERGGGNYLGYCNDSELEANFRKVMGHREFGKVQRFTHTIDEILHDHMPLIPLWQLDTHIAYKDVNPVNLEVNPLLVFGDVDQWTQK
jgi:ABC-type oligopeptide transport system substrate-binding subunit